MCIQFWTSAVGRDMRAVCGDDMDRVYLKCLTESLSAARSKWLKSREQYEIFGLALPRAVCAEAHRARPRPTLIAAEDHLGQQHRDDAVGDIDHVGDAQIHGDAAHDIALQSAESPHLQPLDDFDSGSA